MSCKAHLFFTYATDDVVCPLTSGFYVIIWVYFNLTAKRLNIRHQLPHGMSILRRFFIIIIIIIIVIIIAIIITSTINTIIIIIFMIIAIIITMTIIMK